MARLARKQLADMRALEEQTERMNPINEVHNSYREGYTGIVRGSGATPSMGLSQIRGGRKHKAKMAEGNEDAKAQGKALMEHLHNLHGSGYARDFHAGMAMSGGLGTGRYEGEGSGAGMEGCGTGAGEELKGGFWGALATLAAPLIGSLFGKGQMTKAAHDELMKKLGNAKSKRKAKLEGGFWGALAALAAPLIGKLFGKGEMTKEAHDELMSKLVKKQMLGKEGHGTRKMKGAGRMVGAGNLDIEIKHGEMEGEGTGAGMEGCGTGAGTGAGKMKRVVGAGDGRRKRAEIVKKVMADKGMSMIEASKYVKEHKLY